MRVDKNIRDMQKAGFWETNVHKSGLHPRENFGHTSAIDIANETVVGMPLDEQFHDETLFEQRDTSLTWCGVHNNVNQYCTP
jgi:hypothetical protein